jgi:hypothetical protein
MITPNQLFELFGYYEEGRAFETNGQRRIMCTHYTDQAYTNEDSTTYKANQAPVYLNKFKYSDGAVGYAGKCDVCGKIYYTE